MALHWRFSSVLFSIQPTRMTARDGWRLGTRVVGRSVVSNFPHYSGAHIHSLERRAFQAVGSTNCIIYGPNSTWLVTTRHVRLCRASRARRVERVELCCSTSSTQPKCMGSTRRTCRVVSSGVESSQMEFGLVSIPCSHIWAGY